MSSPETLWQDLLTAALLGSERRALSLPASSGKIGMLLAQLDANDGPHLILSGAALLEKYRQTGRRPLPVAPQPLTPCAPETWPRCGSAAVARLALLLDSDPAELLPEWLERAAAVHRRAPEELLPGLLEWGEAHQDQLDLLLPVLGQRGRWLAPQIPWTERVAAAVFVENISPDATCTVWQTGRNAVRRQLLARLRREEPASALKLLESTWKEDSAGERIAFEEALEAGLSQADEPFLEAALDDRSKDVRRRAAQLLAKLPGSRLVQRQAERVRACLQWKGGGFLRKAQIEVSLPESCDAGMQRDGVEPKRPVKNRGEKADWLCQMLSVVPPSTWSQLWGRSPAELIEAASSGDWKELLHESWIAAAVRHQDAGWAEALLKVYLRQDLLETIPAARRAAFLAGLLQSRPHEHMDLLLGYEAPWGPELTRLFLRNVRAYYLKLKVMPAPYALQAAFLRFARFMDPALADEAEKLLAEKSDPDSAWERAVETMLQHLDARRQLMEELT